MQPTLRKTNEVFCGTFECRRCELEAPATVRAAGWGAAQGRSEDAAANAAFEGEQDASGVASRTLTFVRCPRCGAVDPSALSYRIQVMIGSLLLGLVAAGVVFVFSHVSRRGRSLADVGGVGWLCAIVTLVVAGALYWRWRRPWVRVRERVVLDLSSCRHDHG